MSGLMISYAQNAEDVILDRVFAGQSLGFYIDVGARDPERNSITNHFYLSGWRGINIEPTDQYHALLMKARPEDINLKVAIGSSRPKTRFIEDKNSSRLVPVETHDLKSIQQENFDSQKKIVGVDVVPLSEITAQYAPHEVDFLKIDVGGEERGVIESAEWRAFRPRVLVIASIKAVTQEPTWFSWEGLLFDAGYGFALFDGLNRYYYRAEEPGLRAPLSIPANVLDEYIPIATKKLQDRVRELEGQDTLKRLSQGHCARLHSSAISSHRALIRRYHIGHRTKRSHLTSLHPKSLVAPFAANIEVM
jgi:FkbM family methyltransferase